MRTRPPLIVIEDETNRPRLGIGAGDIGAGGAQALERRLRGKRRGFRTKALYAALAALQRRLREDSDHDGRRAA